MVQEIKSVDDLEKALKEAGDKLVVIDFFATWCGPCKMIAPKLEEFSEKYGNVIFLKVDVDELDELAVKYGVNSMPTFVFIKNSEVLATFSGANADTLKSLVEKHKTA